jgi:hypothetical protein
MGQGKTKGSVDEGAGWRTGRISRGRVKEGVRIEEIARWKKRGMAHERGVLLEERPI